MADIGTGYIRAAAGQTIRIAYTVRKSPAAVSHTVIDKKSNRKVCSFAQDNVANTSDSFTLDAGTYGFAWSALVLAKGASVVVEIAVADAVSYRRERTYSGSGAAPGANGTFRVS